MSDSISINLTGVKTEGFDAVPPGRYSAAVYEVEQKFGKASGSPYLNWTFRVTDGDFEGRRIWYMTSLKPEALWNFKRTAVALGEDAALLAGEYDFDPDEFQGRECVIQVGNETYNGEVRSKVTRVLAEGSPLEEEGESVSDLTGLDTSPAQVATAELPSVGGNDLSLD